MEATLPYYFKTTQEEMKSFFRAIADFSPYPVFIYDLPGVTQCKMAASIVIDLTSYPNINGIKTGDLVLARALHLKQEKNLNFQIF